MFIRRLFLSFTVAGLACYSVGFAAPSGPRRGTTFSIEQVSNPSFRKGSFEDAIVRTYLKYGVPLPKHLEAAFNNGVFVSKRATGSAAALSDATPSGFGDVEYLTPVRIGTPPQELNLDFDTGSSDLWVFSTGLPISQTTGQALYDASRSSTSARLGSSTWRISYGDGSSSSGVVYTDAVTLGNLTVPRQAVEAASQVSNSFTSRTATDGLLGLGFKSINQVRPAAQNTWFDNIRTSLDQPVFSVDLKHLTTGSYDFGYIDTTKYKGTMTYVPVDSRNGYWGFTSSGYQVGSGSFTSRSIQGIADTGTSLLFLPRATVGQAYYDKVAGARFVESTYIFPCAASLPDLTFGVGTGRVTIPGEYLRYDTVECTASAATCNSLCGGSCSTMCLGGLQDSSDLGMNIFGDVALKAAYVVFDAGSNRLGWAQKA
ncbi:Endothiapepsin [Pleurostoma richardsiae]|uniref:Endothiapepsin n=1 Tax=Pleurostoma richardsiae TaxID=41990 RepID=A0AA38S0M0_9PEZI|nr:Endothiapepsin [Pleurostoma richardsiae]